MGKLANEIKTLPKEDLDTYLTKGSLSLKVDGHDFEAIDKVIENAQENKKKGVHGKVCFLG